MLYKAAVSFATLLSSELLPTPAEAADLLRELGWEAICDGDAVLVSRLDAGLSDGEVHEVALALVRERS